MSIPYLELKLLGFCLYLVTSVLGSMAPMILYRLVGARFLYLLPVLLATGVGVILATAFVHIIPASIDFFRQLSPDVEFPYPYALLIALYSALILFMIETETHLWLLPSGVKKNAETATDNDNAEHIKQSVTIHVLEMAVCTHSIPIGLSFGFLNSHSQIVALLCAISFHQFTEGFALGTMIVGNRLRVCHAVALCAFFSVTTPLGVLIGLLLDTTVGGETHTSLILQGVCTGLASGFLVYVALIDILANLFTMQRFAIEENRKQLQHGETPACNFDGDSLTLVSYQHNSHKKAPALPECTSTTTDNDLPIQINYKSNEPSNSEAIDDRDDMTEAKELPFSIRLLSYLAMAVGAGIMSVVQIWV